MIIGQYPFFCYLLYFPRTFLLSRGKNAEQCHFYYSMYYILDLNGIEIQLKNRLRYSTKGRRTRYGRTFMNRPVQVKNRCNTFFGQGECSHVDANHFPCYAVNITPFLQLKFWDNSNDFSQKLVNLSCARQIRKTSRIFSRDKSRPNYESGGRGISIRRYEA